jgi:hypothetical protein
LLLVGNIEGILHPPSRGSGCDGDYLNDHLGYSKVLKVVREVDKFDDFLGYPSVLGIIRLVDVLND